ncbi:hypothetical protein GobsT_69410 [Gemmata obscuriglobus]|uniref:Uncharacterized protein n=1 Tax=Gemmata obscuriglobus TaxID=114 RepID=A0A2Z3HAJ2_9BACT|nr:hypothetical protein C1280_36360 [Gemmata obscuriglobus]QEG32090.1 hypothetical protein GobsT_69410 [Gemmata obscuriglobus]VTS11443.1 unnamed protein product [Gemmata obscuriglobus UQM 2246]
MRYAIVGAAWLWGLWALTVLSDTGFDFCGAAVLLYLGGIVGCAWLTYGLASPVQSAFHGLMWRQRWTVGSKSHVGLKLAPAIHL